MYLIANSKTRTVGVPTYLNARLHERWIDGGADEPMRYEWVCRTDTLPSRGQPLAFPDELWLISKDKKYDFDLYLAHAGILVSETMLDILDSADLKKFRIARVHAVNNKNENISTKQLFYIKQKDVLYGVDRIRSRYIQSKMGGELLYEASGEPSIAICRKLVVDPESAQGRNLFELHDLSGNNTFISNEIREKMGDNNIKGVDFIPVENYFEAERWKIQDLERDYGLPFDQISDANYTR